MSPIYKLENKHWKRQTDQLKASPWTGAESETGAPSGYLGLQVWGPTAVRELCLCPPGSIAPGLP